MGQVRSLGSVSPSFSHLARRPLPNGASSRVHSPSPVRPVPRPIGPWVAQASLGLFPHASRRPVTRAPAGAGTILDTGWAGPRPFVGATSRRTPQSLSYHLGHFLGSRPHHRRL